MEELQQGRLEEWDYLNLNGRLRLTGRVYGHPWFPDGIHIITSEVIDMNANLCMTKDTLYILGERVTTVDA